MASPGWAQVADDLLFLLAERVISAPTFVRFSAVCKSWHSIASATKCCKLVPWVMLNEKEGSELRDFYDHTTKELYRFPLPQAQRVKNFGFAHGWLITGEEDCSFHLLNPLSGTRISLPPATFITENDDDELDGCLDHDTFLLEIRNLVPLKATCSPIGPNNDSIVVLTYWGLFFSLAFCRLSSPEWTLIKDDGSQEVAFIDGVFYIVSNFGHISTLDFTSSPRLIKIADFPDDIMDLNSCHTMNSHIVKCGNEILIGVKIIDRTGDKGHLLVHIRLFKLDIGGKKVIDVEKIGDYALFFGTNDSFCLPTTSYGGFFKRNCIYFTNVDDSINIYEDGITDAGEDMMIYNLEDQSFTTYSVGVSKSLYSYPIWVLFDPLV